MVAEAESPIDTSGAPSSLATAAAGSRLRIVAVRLEAGATDWLAAVGLHEGEEVVVLRRAALGGPLHVRTSSGGEFAVARELAEHLEVAPASETGS
ncbi:MAG: ferrous iron transport protein A [Labilithrix sp.]|nr:ferrous iron transport protein A [Labilithrix sp.]MBX3220343.1 ferrous iron transport protein A [Labilithrix sp.]